MTVVSSSVSFDQFRDEIAQTKPDALVLELPVIGSNTPKMVADLVSVSDAARVVVCYGFGRDADISALRRSGARLVRSP